MLGLIDYLVMATYLALLVVIGVRALKAQDHRTSTSLAEDRSKPRRSRCSGSHLGLAGPRSSLRSIVHTRSAFQPFGTSLHLVLAASCSVCSLQRG